MPSVWSCGSPCTEIAWFGDCDRNWSDLPPFCFDGTTPSGKIKESCKKACGNCRKQRIFPLTLNLIGSFLKTTRELRYIANFLLFFCRVKILEDRRMDKPDSRPLKRFGQDYASRLNIFNKFLELLFVVIIFCYPVIFSFRVLMFLILK